MGNWIFQPESLTLYNPDAMYEVDLEEMKTSADVLDWILQIASKAGNEWDLEGFIESLEEAVWANFKNSLQGVFSPMGRIMIVNWRRKIYGQIQT